MNIDNSNLNSVNSVSNISLNTATRAFEAAKKQFEKPDESEDIKKEDISLIDDKTIKSSKVDVSDIQKYANYMGENLSIDDINYGLRYGRSVIIDYSA